MKQFRRHLRQVRTAREVDMDFYLDYVLAWIHERHREGGELLKTQGYASPFIAGSYTVRASRKALIRFKRKAEALFEEFFLTHKEREKEQDDGDGDLVAVTLAILPSEAKGIEESRNILEFEPDRPLL